MAKFFVMASMIFVIVLIACIMCRSVYKLWKLAESSNTSESSDGSDGSEDSSGEQLRVARQKSVKAKWNNWAIRIKGLMVYYGYDHRVCPEFFVLLDSVTPLIAANELDQYRQSYLPIYSFYKDFSTLGAELVIHNDPRDHPTSVRELIILLLATQSVCSKYGFVRKSHFIPARREALPTARRMTEKLLKIES